MTTSAMIAPIGHEEGLVGLQELIEERRRNLRDTELEIEEA